MGREQFDRIVDHLGLEARATSYDNPFAFVGRIQQARRDGAVDDGLPGRPRSRQVDPLALRALALVLDGPAQVVPAVYGPDARAEYLDGKVDEARRHPQRWVLGLDDTRQGRLTRIVEACLHGPTAGSVRRSCALVGGER